MDLKEYISIIKKHLRIFLFVIFLVVISGFAYFCLRPVSYDVLLALNITRKGTQQTADYDYDYFYRLGADEKIADTIVEWLKSPVTVGQIYENSRAGSIKSFSLKKLTKLLKPEKRSSQLVLVYFSSPSEELSWNISTSIKEEILKNIENLNYLQKDANWFDVLSQDPIIIKRSFNPWIVLVGLSAVGIFLAFWVVLFVHYFKEPLSKKSD